MSFRRKAGFKKSASIGQYSGPPLSKDQKEVVDAIINGEGPFFLTGEAGSGKTFLINYLRDTQPRCVVTAMTGMAAQLVQGRTLHKFAGLHVIHGVVQSKRANRRVRDCDLLIIDEISMASFEILEQLHERFYECDHYPKLLMVGDFLQLPPVEGKKLFEAEDWAQCEVLRLTTQHRQNDPDFINPLNDIRRGKLTERAMDLIRSRSVNELPDDCVHLMAHKSSVRIRNTQKLAQLPGPRAKSDRKIEVPIDGHGKPVSLDPKVLDKARFPRSLCVKIGARVVMLTNDKMDQWVNGSTGEVSHIEKGMLKIVLDNGHEIRVTKDEELILDGDGNVACKIIQYPVQLAWALTTHKSQGMTLDKVGVDLSNHFASGQTYVAMSRCRTKEGLFLTGKIEELLVDPAALELWETGKISRQAIEGEDDE